MTEMPDDRHNEMVLRWLHMPQRTVDFRAKQRQLSRSEVTPVGVTSGCLELTAISNAEPS